MITTEQYFGAKIQSTECTLEMLSNAANLLALANNLLFVAFNAGAYGNEIDPDTGTQISGAKGGAGDGGFRLSTTKTGAVSSTHRRAQGIDIYDPQNKLDAWLTDATLMAHGLFREHPDATNTWCHLQSVPPGSGHRTYKP